MNVWSCMCVQSNILSLRIVRNGHQSVYVYECASSFCLWMVCWHFLINYRNHLNWDETNAAWGTGQWLKMTERKVFVYIPFCRPVCLHICEIWGVWVWGHKYGYMYVEWRVFWGSHAPATLVSHLKGPPSPNSHVTRHKSVIAHLHHTDNESTHTHMQ